jgi:hypothetical protein
MELRPLRLSDIDAIESWLPRAAADARCDRWSDANALRDAAGRKQVVVCVEDGPAALLEYDTDAPCAGAAQVRFLAVEPGARRLGAGGRAALALERKLKRSARAIYVLIPEHLGLALYFWLRLGYRPLTQGDWPVAPDEGASTWMVRELG